MSRQHKEIRFVSGNKFKIAEAEQILSAVGVAVVPVALKIEELQITDTPKLVRDKLLKAFGKIRRPLFVEHTGLYLKQLNMLPGGLTQVFWDALGAELFTERFGRSDTQVIAKTTVAYCDGRRIYQFEGEIEGEVVATPRGSRDFQWDCVFQPKGYDKTFAELGDKKNEISMRRLALNELSFPRFFGHRKRGFTLKKGAQHGQEEQTIYRRIQA